MNMKLTLTAILFALASQVLASPSKNTINACENLETFVNKANNLKNLRSSKKMVDFSLHQKSLVR